MDALAALVLAECKTKYPNAAFAVADEHRASPAYEILLNGVGNRSALLSLQENSAGYLLVIRTSTALKFLDPKDEEQVMAIVRTQLPSV
jgi:hypothetical protein